jgi:hypothetical protein
VSRGGLVWLGEVADRSGLTAGLSLCWLTCRGAVMTRAWAWPSWWWRWPMG